MGLKYRSVGDSGAGNNIDVDLTPNGDLWNGTTWGGGMWSGGQTSEETLFNLGSAKYVRIQVRFDNKNTIGSSFKVFWNELYANIKSER